MPIGQTCRLSVQANLQGLVEKKKEKFHEDPLFRNCFRCPDRIFHNLGTYGPRVTDEAPALRARVILQQADSLSSSMVRAADQLAIEAKDQELTDTQRLGLDVLRTDINQIGRDLRMLRAEPGALFEYQRQAASEARPLMQRIAANTEDAIQTFNGNRGHLWATAFPDETAGIYRDAERVKAVLDGNLKLAAAQAPRRQSGNAAGGTQ